MASKWGKGGIGAVSGAATGTAIAPGIGTLIGGGLGFLSGLLGGDDGPSEEELQQMRELQAQKKARQLNAVNSMQAPTMSDSTRARIKALQDESRPTSLVEDPYFQGQRAQVVQGGQQALSSVQNANRAQGTSGGFSNQGSINDVYDRLSGQLSNLAQNSAMLKDQKAQQAADMEQAYQDALTTFHNQRMQALQAIEEGDSDFAMQMLQNAMDTRQKIQEMDGNRIGTAMGGLATLASPAAAALKGTGETSKVVASTGGNAYTGTPTSMRGSTYPLSSPQAGSMNSILSVLNSPKMKESINKPWAAMRA